MTGVWGSVTYGGRPLGTARESAARFPRAPLGMDDLPDASPPDAVRAALERAAAAVVSQYGGLGDEPPRVSVTDDVVVVVSRSRASGSGGSAAARIVERAVRVALLEAVEATLERDVVSVLGDRDDETGTTVDVFVLDGSGDGR